MMSLIFKQEGKTMMFESLLRVGLKTGGDTGVSETDLYKKYIGRV